MDGSCNAGHAPLQSIDETRRDGRHQEAKNNITTGEEWRRAERERERDREREGNMMDATNLVKRPQWRRLLIGSPRRTLPRPLLGDNQLASVGWKYPRHGWQPFLEPAQNDAPSVSVAGVPPGGVPVPYPYNHPHLTVALASQSHYRV